jgi:hypothetical protein
MLFSLFVVYEGDRGPVPVCRVADAHLTESVAAFALAKATRTAEAMSLIDPTASHCALRDVDRLRAVLATI